MHEDGVFDFCARDYDSLPERTLFLHGHDTSWHQRTPVARILDAERKDKDWELEEVAKHKKLGKYKVHKAHGGANEAWMRARLELLDDLEKEAAG